MMPAVQADACASPSPDLDGDGDVDGADLGLLLGAWGPCDDPDDCPADLDDSGAVEFRDMLRAGARLVVFSVLIVTIAMWIWSG